MFSRKMGEDRVPDWKNHMTRAESHYLSCQDKNCERFACLARRDYEGKIEKLEGDVLAAQERIACGDLLSAGPDGKGKFELRLKPAKEIVQAMCAGMAEMVGEANYVECEMGPYTVTVQKRVRPTPHEKRKQAEALLTEVESHFAHGSNDDGMDLWRRITDHLNVQDPHRNHGRGDEHGPEDPDCTCRGTDKQKECAVAGCGFCKNG
jgi:hypothetical protein